MSHYISPNGKRNFLEYSNIKKKESISPIPMKKQRQIECFAAIRTIKQTFTPQKLLINSDLSRCIANDPLFAHPRSSNNSSHIRWVLACKFVIASQLRLDSYDVLGMQRNKIPSNMHFYVDHAKNLCAVIQHKENSKDTLSNRIIQHCNQIETSIIQSYIGCNINKMKSNVIQQCIDDEDEDDDLWTNNDKENIDVDDEGENEEEGEREKEIITIIRIPMIYYLKNMQSSFYELCCRIAAYIYNVQHDFGNPLFQLLFRNIANFDCFQLSVPMVPLKGSLYPMFCQYGLGVYQHHDENVKNKAINSKEFESFLGLYDCWKMNEYKKECRKSMHKYWRKVTETDTNIMNIVIEFSDLNEMTNDAVIDYVKSFDDTGSKYQCLVNELKQEITDLNEIVDFNTKWF